MATLGPFDPSSFAQPDFATISHIHLSLNADFKRHVLHGCVLLTVAVKRPSKTLVLDTRDLIVHKVTNNANKSALSFTLEKPVASFGSALVIQLPAEATNSAEIRIDYETTEQCSALQWLTPQQTAGKKHPYLFSQCQAIHARSMVPCQDTPGVKMPYTAEISAPKELTVLMSAINTSRETVEDKTVHQFKQEIAIPSYLIAIVIGALRSREIGPRSSVWCEQEMLDAAAYEFAETEKMIKAAEELAGPYIWGRYDLLILPPSFPYGGMENPCLTFVTPTLLSGYRSLSYVVAHEVSHSWTGNLVTNSNPEHFWLNEGHTVFLERKIAGRLMGEQMRHLMAVGGWADLTQTIKVLGESSLLTYLVPKLDGISPDDAFSLVPYEKGSSLLMHLEQLLGGPEVFEPFLKSYIDHFKLKSITTDDWKTFLYDYFKDKKSVLDSVNWNQWFHSPGMPPVKPKFDTTLVDQCTSLAQKYINDDVTQFRKDDISKFSPYQLQILMKQLLEHEPPVALNRVEKLEEIFGFLSYRNNDLKYRWLCICLRAKLERAVAIALQFVREQGRMKYVRPIYRELYAWEFSRDKAIDNYNKSKAEMHPLTAAMLAKDLKLVQ